jgi:hypothetical protein
LENIGYHSLDGFEMGRVCLGSSDLALTILLDFLGVPLAEALRVYRARTLDKLASTSDVRVLRAWMSHQRLLEQRLMHNEDECAVSGFELERLLERKFLNDALEREWEHQRAERELDQRAETKRLSYEKSKKPCVLVKEKS